MATTVDIASLRESLRASHKISEQASDILKQICALVSDQAHETDAIEMVLRALEHRKAFGQFNHVLNALVRTVGLFPYADPDVLDFRDRLAYEFHRPLDMPDDTVFHRVQAEVYRRLLAGENVVLSAPTSFGKSKIIDAMIATKRYTNVAVIVPTLALIDETRRRLSQFSNFYKIITHLSQQLGERNILVLTPERAIAFDPLPKIDFFIIDEFYKLSANNNDETRMVALNQAFYRLAKGGGQFYFLGPNIEQISKKLEQTFRCTFLKTNYATVVSEQVRVSEKGEQIEKLLELAKELTEPTLIFCSSPARVNATAAAFVDAGIGIDAEDLKSASDWVAIHYHRDWIFGRALLHGIGIHHGKLPRALSQYVVRMFNEEKIRFLICTSTLIEGVNTKAKNVIIYDNKIARQKIDYFTFNNIKGRSGRMFQHFIGRVYIFDEPPDQQLPIVDFPVLTQGDEVPASLLVQLDDEDLSEKARILVDNIKAQNDLPMNVIRENSCIDPIAQIALAKEIAQNAVSMSQQLAWTGFPSQTQLEFACEMIWKHFIGSAQRKATVSSGRQLAFKLNRLWQIKNTAELVKFELEGSYAAQSPDEAVERVLDFERTWATFEFPRYLVALSKIQKSVFTRLGLPSGDYSAFAAQVECLFRTPVVAALDEYGIPLQVAEKIQNELGAKDDLDLALKRLKVMNLNRLFLTSFERDILRDAQQAI